MNDEERQDAAMKRVADLLERTRISQAMRDSDQSVRGRRARNAREAWLSSRARTTSARGRMVAR